MRAGVRGSCPVGELVSFTCPAQPARAAQGYLEEHDMLLACLAEEEGDLIVRCSQTTSALRREVAQVGGQLTSAVDVDVSLLLSSTTLLGSLCILAELDGDALLESEQDALESLCLWPQRVQRTPSAFNQSNTPSSS